MIDVEKVMSLLHVSKSTAYQIIRGLNAELTKKGYMTVKGKVPEKYLRERYCLEEEA